MSNTAASTSTSTSHYTLPTSRNVLLIGLDGLRWDCITPDITPTLWACIKQQLHQTIVTKPTTEVVVDTSVSTVQAAASDSSISSDLLAASSSSPPTVSSIVPSSLLPPSSLPSMHCAWSLRSQVGDICWSGPGWTSALTSVWRNKHGVSGNTFGTQQFHAYPTLFQRLKKFHKDAVTACAINWRPLSDSLLLDCDHTNTHEDDDTRVLASACALLQQREQLDGLFVHLDDVDHAGHEYDYGPNIKEYVQACKNTDNRVRTVLSTLFTLRPSNWLLQEDWLIILTTDHGGLDFTHAINCQENRRNWVMVLGSDVSAGEIFPPPLIVDIATTAWAHWGIPISNAWNLDGRPVGLKLSQRIHYMDLVTSQDPLNLHPISQEELEDEGMIGQEVGGAMEAVTDTIPKPNNIASISNN